MFSLIKGLNKLLLPFWFSISCFYHKHISNTTIAISSEFYTMKFPCVCLVPFPMTVSRMHSYTAHISVWTTSCKERGGVEWWCRVSISTPAGWASEKLPRGLRVGQHAGQSRCREVPFGGAIPFRQRRSAQPLSNINCGGKCHIFQARQQCWHSAGMTLNSRLGGQQTGNYLFTAQSKKRGVSEHWSTCEHTF